MRIVFCLPGNTFSDNFLKSWTELLMYLPKYGITPILSSSYNSVVYYVRNQCLGGSVLAGKNQHPFNGQNYDYIMWIDSDMVFTVDDFIGLLIIMLKNLCFMWFLNMMIKKLINSYVFYLR